MAERPDRAYRVHMRTFASPLLPALMFLLASGTPSARADGISIEKEVALDELVQTSAAIFTATLLATKAQWAEREAYGTKQRYVQHYRFRIKITGWLKGAAKTPAEGALWLHYRGDPIPGKWMIVKEYYDSAFEPGTAKPGTTVVVFASGTDIDGWGTHVEMGRAVLHTRAIDTEARLDAVKAALARSSARSLAPDASPER
jgi:hypothetical protein